MMFFHHENPHEASNGFVKAVTPQRFSKFSNVKFSPLCEIKLQKAKYAPLFQEKYIPIIGN